MITTYGGQNLSLWGILKDKMIKSLWFLLTLQIVWGARYYKKCHTSSILQICPEGTKCSETIQTDPALNPYTGECRCMLDNYEFNTNYKDDSDYCVYVEPKNNADNRVMASSSEAISGEAIRLPDSSHHIIAGILISICFVVIFTLIVVGVKKLHIKQRIRNMRMTQRNRPLYEDVMMGNDTDDPPLI